MNDEDWRRRLIEAIEQDNRSYAEISRAAGLGRAYVQQMVEYGKEPSVGRFLRICHALRVSVSYILTGVRMTAEEQEFLIRIASLSSEQKDRLLGLVRDLQQRDDPPPQ